MNDRGIKHCFVRLTYEIYTGKRATSSRAHRRRLAVLHGNEDGKIAIVTVVVVMVFIVLIGLVGNAGNAAVDKIELQNAADAAAYSTALWQARGMNAITATNHLMGELTALLVIHEAFGGPTLGGEEKSSDVSKNFNDNYLTQYANDAKYKSTTPTGYAYFLTAVDNQLVPKLCGKNSGYLVKDKGKHSAGATIYDAQMTLKYCASVCVVAKAGCNSAYGVAEALQNSYFAAIGVIMKLALDAIHISASFALVKVGQEWLYLKAVEAAAEAIQEKSDVKKRIREDLIPLLSSYSDYIAGYSSLAMSASQKQGPSQLAKPMDDTLKNMGSWYRRHNIKTLAIFPPSDVFRFPVVPEPRIEKAEGSEKEERYGEAPSLWGDDDWQGPFREIANAYDGIARLIGRMKSAVSDYEDWSGVNIGVPFGEFNFYQLPEPQKKITKINGHKYKKNKGVGYDDSPSFSELKQIPWGKEQYSQWIRATYPYVDSFRRPIRKWFQDNCGYSNASTYYVNWTNRYTIDWSYKIRHPSDSNSSSDQQGQDDQAKAKALAEFRSKIRKLREDWRTALNPNGSLDSNKPALQPLDKIADDLKALADAIPGSKTEEALRDIKFPVDEWVESVRKHRSEAKNFADQQKPDAELEIDEQAYREWVEAITLAALQDELLRKVEGFVSPPGDSANQDDDLPHMYVMREMDPENKGFEPWTVNNDLAEKYFTLVAFAYRGPGNPSFFGTGVIFENHHAGGTIACAQAMYYNAGGRYVEGKRNTDKQVDTGWDTLNWKHPVEAREWKADPSGPDDRDPWQIFGGSRKADKYADPVLNWQAKLVPLTESRLKDATNDSRFNQETRDVLKPLLHNDNVRLFTN